MDNKQSGTSVDSHCVICRQLIENNDHVKVTRKRLTTLIKFSELRQDSDLYEFLSSKLDAVSFDLISVHSVCRKKYTDPRNVARGLAEEECVRPRKKLRSTLQPFDWKRQCFLCGEDAIVDRKHRNRGVPVYEIRTIESCDKLKMHCDRRMDTWAEDVKMRLNSCIDLVAAEARYHEKCYRDFRKDEHQNTVGRPTDDSMVLWFNVLCNWLETEGEAELYTLDQLHSRMTNIANGAEVYTIKRLRQKLEEHYGNHVFFAQMGGSRMDVVCFRDMAAFIINEKWYAGRNDNSLKEAERIMITAAKIIREEIREREYVKEIYPSSDDIKDIEKGKQFLTPCLRMFVDSLIPDTIKRNSIGQSILQSVRPRSIISPLMFGLGIELDHVFGSKWLIDELFQLGFCISYPEVMLYKQSVLQDESIKTLLPPPSPVFTQWAADNVDHNIRTLNGEGTFHGMGIIAMSTSNIQHSLIIDRRIKRKARIGADELISNKGIPIVPYIGPPCPGLSVVKFIPILSLQTPYTILPSVYYSNVLWQSAQFLSNMPTPNWSGYMQHIFRSENETFKSEVVYLPIIDLNPNDETCVYSTLLYIQEQAACLNLPTACVTFDQPLWLKAMEIITAKGLDKIVCRLGGFHLLMSACGSIGQMMKGSGLEQALGQVYGSNVVGHMMSGKAIARALRGHYLVEAALMKKIIATITPQTTGSIDSKVDCENCDEMHNCETSETVDPNDHILDEPHVSAIQELLSGVMDLSKSIEDIVNSVELLALDECIKFKKMSLETQSRTSKLWFQYLEYIQVIKEFIMSERTGDWEGHLRAVGKFLNLFAATGHINYAKSARLYLQVMNRLHKSHPWLYERFVMDGFHTVRRSERFWAGLWSDLVIEQVLMRSIKSRGGLTRGRGMSESVRQQWIYSMHMCASIHEAMTTVTLQKHITSAQHVEMGTSRKDRDFQDINKIKDWFDLHDPFNTDLPHLRSLSTGLTAIAGDGINCDETERVGMDIQRTLDGQTVAKTSIKRSQQVHTLQNLKPGITIEKQTVYIDPAILFLRCTALAQREDDNVEPYFAYEMTAMPTSLFNNHLMRKGQKSALAVAIQKGLINHIQDQNLVQNSMPVVDGGLLLHRVRWRKSTTYGQIIEQYVSYINSKYGLACIVFDGYTGPSTKDHEHSRRCGKISAEITVSKTSMSHDDQDAFLANEKNKTQFIELLASNLRSHNHCVKISDGDADTLIVSTVLEYARNDQAVLLVAEDTDIFVMMLYHWNAIMAYVYILKETKRTQKTAAELFSVREACTHVGDIVCNHILLIHAWSGCDTTSATFGHGKTLLMKMLPSSNKIQELSSAISCQESTAMGVGTAGSQLFCILYGCDNTTLTAIRYAKYMKMVVNASKIEPKRLPPTERSTYFHSLRVHLQVVRWETLDHGRLVACEWGWKVENSMLLPIMTDKESAPQNVLKFIRCRCKIARSNMCGTNQCTCYKNGLKCVMVCEGCRGQSCNNTECIPPSEQDSDLDL